jgi:hypothetical protein
MGNLYNIIFCFISYFNFLSLTYWVLCPDGTIRLVYRNPTNAIPIPLNLRTVGETGFGVKDIAGQEVNLSASWETEISPHIGTLNDNMLGRYLRSAENVKSYHSNPCKNDRDYRKKIDEDTIFYHELDIFRERLKAFIIYANLNPSDPMNSHLLMEICRQPFGKEKCLKKEFQDSQKGTDEWMRRGGGGNAS